MSKAALAGALLLASACVEEKRFVSGDPAMAPLGWIECSAARRLGEEGAAPCGQMKR